MISTIYYYSCYGCGHQFHSEGRRLRKCPQCGRHRLVQTGCVSVSAGKVSIEKRPKTFGR